MKELDNHASLKFCHKESLKPYLHGHAVERMNQDNQLVGRHQGDILLVGSHLVVDILIVGNRLEVGNHLEVDILPVGSHLVVDILVVDSPVEGIVLEDIHRRHEQDVRRALCHRPGACLPLFCQSRTTGA